VPFRPPEKGTVMHHFALVTPDGESLGVVELSRPDWPEGSVISRGDKPDLRVIADLMPDAPNVDGVLVVEEV
jgi:hypothetical protein